jgi:hypothetical protein
MIIVYLGIAEYIGQSQRRKKFLSYSYFKSNVDSTEENGGYKIHERRVRTCVYVSVHRCGTDTERIGRSAV